MTRILVVDEDRILGNLLRVNLEVRGYQVAMASSGAEGLVSAQNERPDLVMLGPGMSGLSHKKAMAALKEDLGLQQVPVIIVMDYRHDDDDFELFNSGIPGVCLKPFDIGQLLETVKGLIADKGI